MLIYNIGLDLALLLVFLLIARKRREHEAQETFLAEQELFMGRLAEQYGRCRDMEEALEKSAGGFGTLLQREAARILAALSSDEFSGEAGSYARGAQNSYFVLLFTLCQTIRTFGDMQVAGVSLFVHNIRYIREELRIELLRRQEGRYAFLGLTMLSILPFFFTVVIRFWSGSISVELDRYYGGAYGFAVLTVCFFLTLLSAFFVQELQYPTMQKPGGDAAEKRLLGIPLIRALIDRHIARHYSHYLKKNETLKKLQGFGNIREFFVRKLLTAALLAPGLWMVICGSALAGGSFPVGGAAFAFLTLCAMALGYVLPDAWAILLQARVERQEMEETMRFQTLVLIVRNYRQITVEEILHRMECFSSVFSRAFQRAVDDFPYRRREALERLKEELGYEPAKKLVDGLLACDETAVAQAFYDMEGERAYDMEQYQKKEQAAQREKAALARIVAFLPFVAVLALWMIVPFVMEGLTQLRSY